MKEHEKIKLLEERARKLAKKLEHEAFEVKKDAVGFLVFELDKQRFAVSVEKVVQTVLLGRMVDLVSVPPHVRGITRISGKSIPLVYLPFYFYPNREGFVDADNVVVIKEQNTVFGLLVHRLLEIRSLVAAEIMRTPDNIPLRIRQVLAGTTKDGIAIIDVSKLVLAEGFALTKRLEEGK